MFAELLKTRGWMSSWWTTLLVVPTALLTLILIEVISESRLGPGEFFYFLVFAPFAAIILFVIAVNTKKPPAWATALLFCVAVALFGVKASAIRSQARWLLASGLARDRIALQVQPAAGQLKHVEWDGWGFAGAGETNVYLVFDPDDALRTAVNAKDPIRAKGLPCDVWKVNKLENQWYAVTFYTDTGWDDCR